MWGDAGMTLKEKVLNRKPSFTKEEIEAIRNSPEIKRYDKFLDICERLQENVDLSDIECNTYQDAFDLVEKYNVYIFDIVPKDEWDQFKKYMMEDKAKCAPMIGKDPDRIYDLSKPEDYIEYANMKDEELLS